jgi:hypothetical protein
MDWQDTLIKVYLFLCERFKAGLAAHTQRMSNNNQPHFSDEEVLAIYLFGIMQGHTQIKSIHHYTRAHLSGWFPNLPSYQSYVDRLGRLAYALIALIEQIRAHADLDGLDQRTMIVDSFPVVVASSKRGVSPRLAPELVNKGHCASKGLFFHGCKIHIIAQRRPGGMPLPFAIGLYKASENDLTAARPLLARLGNCRVFADKAYNDRPLKEHLENEQDVQLITPAKRTRDGPPLRADQELYSELVSRVRQPIESLFNWIIEKTGINVASKVRSHNGLLVHVFGKLATAIFMLVFNS